MAFSTIELEASQLERLQARIRRAYHPDVRVLLDAIGTQQENSARKRIERTKKTPGGVRWKEWSRRYGQTRHAGQSLLRNEGDLADSLTYQPQVAEADVLVGSPLVYAATQLFGRGAIPAREFLDTDGGFADPHDREDLLDRVEQWLEEELLP